MGRCLCQKHGDTYISPVCHHLATAVYEGTPGLAAKEIESPAVNDKPFATVCLPCYVPFADVDTADWTAWVEAFEKYWNQPLEAACNKCLEEYQGAGT
jgi:hypothetical protein